MLTRRNALIGTALIGLPLRARAASSRRHIGWGIETWRKGQNDFVIRFNESHPVAVVRIQGDMTAGPQPNHAPFDQLIRQSLASLVVVGAPTDTSAVTIVGEPPTYQNESIDNNLFSLNVKQTDAETMNVPIDYVYADPVVLPQNKLLMRIFNESYKNRNGLDIVSTDQIDALNVEIHLVIDYLVN